MKKMTAWLILLCLLLSTGAVAEVGSELVLSEDLLAFKNELTGEVVRLGMTVEEIEAVAGQPYWIHDVKPFRWCMAYEGGLIVFYRRFNEAAFMTVIPTLLDVEDAVYDEDLPDGEPDPDQIPVERAYSPHIVKGNLFAIQNDTGLVLEQANMDRAEIEAITGPALREQVLDDEFLCIDYYEDELHSLQSKEPGRMILADYDGISVLYGIMEDGEVRALYFCSGQWYSAVNGWDVNDSGEEIAALLGEYAMHADAEFKDKYGYDYLETWLHRTEAGFELISDEEQKQLQQAYDPQTFMSNVFNIDIRLGEFGKVSRITVQDAYYATMMN